MLGHIMDAPGTINQKGYAVDFGGPGTPTVFNISNQLISEPRLSCLDTAVYAGISGTVTYENDGCDEDPQKMVVITNTSLGIKLSYIHTDIGVPINSTVQAGQRVGTATSKGCTGDTEFVHTHFNVRELNGTHLSYDSDHVNGLANQWQFVPVELIESSTLMDANANGKADVFAYHAATRKLRVVLSTGTSYVPSQLWSNDSGLGSDWKILNPADVNGNGKTDLVAYHPATRKIRVVLSSGTNFTSSQIWSNDSGLGTDWQLLNPGDANGDGKADIIAYHAATTKFRVMLSTGTKFSASTVWNSNSDLGSNWKILAPADVNSDGKVDIIAYQPSTSKFRVSLSKGTSFTFGSAIWNSNSGLDSSWAILDPADVNGNLKADIIAYHGATRKIKVMLSTGTSFTATQIWNSDTGLGTDWQLLTPSDATGDGKADLIAYHEVSRKLRVAPSTGTNFNGASGSDLWSLDSGLGTGWTVL